MAEAPRLLARATEAFVDGAPIDWSALLARLDSASDLALVESLRELEGIRDGRRSRERLPAPAPQSTLGATIVIAIGCVQTAASLAAFGIAWAHGVALADRVPQLVLAVAFVCASAPLAAVARREPGSLFLLAAFISSAAAFARSSLAGGADVWSAVLRSVPLEAFTPACLWQFAVDFPRVRRFARFDLLARRTAAAAWLVGLLLFVANVPTAIDDGPLVYLLRDHASRLYWLVFALAELPAVLVIFVRARRAPASERRRVARFAFSLAAGSAPFLLSGLVWAALPELGEWIRGIPLFNGLSIAALIASPILSSVAVVADGRMPVGALLHDSFRSAMRRSAATIAPWERDDDEPLARALERVRLARGVREMAATLVRELRRLVRARTVHVLMADRSGRFVDPQQDVAPLPASSVVIAVAGQSTSPVDLSADGALHRLLPRDEREWVTASGAGLVAALKRRDGSTVAIVAMAPREGARFGRRDRWLVMALLTAASAAWPEEPFDANGHAVSDTLLCDASGRNDPADSDEAAFECARCGRVESCVPLSCGCAAEAHVAALSCRLEGKFEVVRRLGAGGMGVVYLARDLTLDRDVALKTLPEVRPDAVARLRDEARAMAALNHDALATIYGLEVWRRTPVLVVEYFPNGTLAHRLHAGPLPPVDAVRLGIRVAGALAHMHANGRLHRDLKPGNIGLTATSAGKLLDFGLATLVPRPSSDRDPDAMHDEAVTPEFAGTLAYLPPEAYGGAAPAETFDLWALSMTLLEAITGENPVAALDRQRRFRRTTAHDFSEVHARHFASTPALRQFFERALASRPEERFQTAVELQRALETLLHRLEPVGLRG